MSEVKCLYGYKYAGHRRGEDFNQKDVDDFMINHLSKLGYKFKWADFLDEDVNNEEDGGELMMYVKMFGAYMPVSEITEQFDLENGYKLRHMEI